MMTKEEYQKTLIRMWDSVRDGGNKEKPDCIGVKCDECPIASMCLRNRTIFQMYDAIEAVEKWGKEHPIKTNGTEFLKTFPDAEVFGYNSNDDFVDIKLDSSKSLDTYGNCIKFPITWWDKEVDE